MDEGAAVLVAEGEVGGGEGGERGGVAGLRGAEELLRRWAPLPAAAGVDVHRRHQGVAGTGRREGTGSRRSSEGKRKVRRCLLRVASGLPVRTGSFHGPRKKKEDDFVGFAIFGMSQSIYLSISIL